MIFVRFGLLAGPGGLSAARDFSYAKLRLFLLKSIGFVWKIGQTGDFFGETEDGWDERGSWFVSFVLTM